MIEFPYDSSYEPSAPVMEITLTTIARTHRRQTFALIDTGADATIAPVKMLRHIGARPAFASRLRSQWGEHRSVLLYLVDMQIGEQVFPGVYVVGDDLGAEVILGRDILNRLRILLDGPNDRVQVE